MIPDKAVDIEINGCGDPVKISGYNICFETLDPSLPVGS